MGQAVRSEQSSISGTGSDVYDGDAIPSFFIPTRSQDDRVVFFPNSRDYIFRRFRPGQETVALNMNALGQPATIRILPDRKFAETQPMPAANEHPHTSSGECLEDLMRTIATDNEAVDPAAVNDNIEELRRYFFLGVGGVIQSPTLARCREVAQELDNGFTSDQIRGYLNQQDHVVGTKDYDCLEARYYSALCTRSAWFSGVSPFPQEAMERLDPGTGGRRRHAFIMGVAPPEGTERQTGKQLLIERLLRQAWKVRCKEEKAMKGELDIRLHPQHLKLLLNHKTDMFGTLSEQYGAKIEISQSQHIVRLTGSYAICSDLSKLIYYMLEKIQDVVLDLPLSLQEPGKDEERKSSPTKHWYKEKNPLRYKSPPAAIARSILNDSSYIKHVEKLTNTLIETIRSTQGNYVSKLRIYYIGPEPGDFDDVQRLVFQLLRPNAIERKQTHCDPPVKVMVPTQTPIEVGSTVPWTERGTQWVRWRDEGWPKGPRGNKSNMNSRMKIQARYDPLQSREVAKATGCFLSEGRRRYADVAIRQRHPTYWQINQEHKVSAVLGYIVYPALLAQAKTELIQARTYVQGTQNARYEKAFLKTIDSRRTMTTNLPDILQSLEDVPFYREEIRHELRVRLTPSRVEDVASVDLKHIPEIDLRIGLGKDKESIEIRSVQLIRDRSESDLLLPQELADIRFGSYTASEATPVIDPTIERFVDESNFDVWGEERLRTPSKLNLRIPRWAISHDAGQDVTRTTGVEYAYDSMEYLSYMSMSFRGVRMFYTTVEAGKAGGRRFELRFEATLEDSRSVKREFVPFFDTVREFVARMHRRPEASVTLEDTKS